jgi:hypothetical protein
MILLIFSGVGTHWVPWLKSGDGYLRIRWLGAEVICYSPGMAREILKALDGG